MYHYCVLFSTGRPRITNSVVLITGASDGIGRACALELKKRGAKLSLTGRSAEKLADVAGEGDLTTAVDLTHPDAPEILIERTMARFGQLDVVINNAGMGVYRPVASSLESETRAMFDLNFFAPMKLAQAAIPVMRNGRGGTIVNVGSIAGHVALPWMPLYSASKSSLGALTESLRMELAQDGIHVMLVSPGYILTHFHEHSLGLAPPPKVAAGKRFAISPERCAQDIVRGIERRARNVVTPGWGWFFIGMHRLAPWMVESRLISLNEAVSRL